MFIRMSVRGMLSLRSRFDGLVGVFIMIFSRSSFFSTIR